MSEFQLCACGSAPGYPHRKDCPCPLYNPTDSQFEQWEKEWLAKREKLNMKTQHTPAWEITRRFGVTAPALEIREITSDNERWIAYVDPIAASLIHAAPDLLAACKTALPLLAKLLEASQGIDGIVDSRLNLECDIEQVQTAIAKAQE